MNRAVTILGVVLALAGMSSAATVVIDNFEEFKLRTDVPPGLGGGGIIIPPDTNPTTTTESGLLNSNVIGGVRRTTAADLLTNSQLVTANIFDPNPPAVVDHILSLSANDGAQGQWLLEYGVTPGGTAPGDLTAGGNADAIVFTFETADLSASVDMWASDGTNSAGPVNKPTPGPGSLIFLFSEFPGVDFTSIDDLSFRINGVPSGDYSISLLETRYHDLVVPEPVTMVALMAGIGGLGGYIRRRRR